MSESLTGSMQGLGAAGTGYGGSSGNSLLQQLILRSLMSGGGSSSFSPSSPLSGNITNNPLTGLLQPAQRTMAGMNPTATAPTAQLQGTNTGLSSTLGGSNLQSLIQVLQNQQKAGGAGGGIGGAGQGGTVYGTPNNPDVMTGLWNMIRSGQWAPSSAQNLLASSGTPQDLQSRMNLGSNQSVP